jgi:hypothetical protein
MPDLDFKIEGAEAVQFSATPQIIFKLHLADLEPDEAIQSIALRCQIQLEVTRRRYSADEQQKLRDLFGEPERWSQTLRPLLWTHVNVNVPSFEKSTIVDLPVPCTFDFNVGATKYFHGVSDGNIPLCFMFSGTVFYASEGAHMQVAPISWNKECRFSMPVKIWRDLMDTYYPNSAWLCLQRDIFDRLYEYKVSHGIPTWEQALESMLQVAQTEEETAVRS